MRTDRPLSLPSSNHTTVTKLAAFREKDVRFVTALTRAGLIDPQVALDRLEHTDLHPVARQRAAGLLAGLDPAAPAEEAGAERLRRSIENEKRVPHSRRRTRVATATAGADPSPRVRVLGGWVAVGGFQGDSTKRPAQNSLNYYLLEHR